MGPNWLWQGKIFPAINKSIVCLHIASAILSYRLLLSLLLLLLLCYYHIMSLLLCYCYYMYVTIFKKFYFLQQIYQCFGLDCQSEADCIVPPEQTYCYYSNKACTKRGAKCSWTDHGCWAPYCHDVNGASNDNS